MPPASVGSLGSMEAAPAVTLPEPFYERGEHVAIDLPGARALFTTRRGGFSEGPYASLNLGRLTDDRPDAVRHNRARLQEHVGARPAHIRQVHGTVVRKVGDPSDPFVAPLPEGGIELPEADGQATRLRGVAPMVLTADCLPIALAARGAAGTDDGGAVVMLHAGWRGLAGGIVAEGVRAVRELGADGPLEAAIGPGAGACCYEVGEEVHAVFAHHGDRVRRGRNLDLKAIARDQLEQAGVQAVHDVELCTICSDAVLFFSHRRDRGVTGRQAGLVWLS
jgi:purine-nucleoside/S-methyl-5'-thioadenosine phosphorylase / adenosine deaminase